MNSRWRRIAKYLGKERFIDSIILNKRGTEDAIHTIDLVVSRNVSDGLTLNGNSDAIILKTVYRRDNSLYHTKSFRKTNKH